SGYASRPTLHALRSYALTLFLFALGLMSKPMLVTLPFVLLLLDYWPLRRFLPAEGSRRREEADKPAIWKTNRLLTSAATFGQLAAEKVPFFALSLLSCYISLIVQQRSGAVITSLSL